MIPRRLWWHITRPWAHITSLAKRLPHHAAFGGISRAHRAHITSLAKRLPYHAAFGGISRAHRAHITSLAERLPYHPPFGGISRAQWRISRGFYALSQPLRLPLPPCPLFHGKKRSRYPLLRRLFSVSHLHFPFGAFRVTQRAPLCLPRALSAYLRLCPLSIFLAQRRKKTRRERRLPPRGGSRF